MTTALLDSKRNMDPVASSSLPRCLSPMSQQMENDNFYKTKICPRYKSHASCRRGESCPFAHSPEELRPLPDLRKTKLCKNNFEPKSCPMGDQCPFAHGEHELRVYDVSSLESGSGAAQDSRKSPPFSDSQNLGTATELEPQKGKKTSRGKRGGRNKNKLSKGANSSNDGVVGVNTTAHTQGNLSSISPPPSLAIPLEHSAAHTCFSDAYLEVEGDAVNGRNTTYGSGAIDSTQPNYRVGGNYLCEDGTHDAHLLEKLMPLGPLFVEFLRLKGGLQGNGIKGHLPEDASEINLKSDDNLRLPHRSVYDLRTFSENYLNGVDRESVVDAANIADHGRKSPQLIMPKRLCSSSERVMTLPQNQLGEADALLDVFAGKGRKKFEDESSGGDSLDFVARKAVDVTWHQSPENLACAQRFCNHQSENSGIDCWHSEQLMEGWPAFTPSHHLTVNGCARSGASGGKFPVLNDSGFRNLVDDASSENSLIESMPSNHSLSSQSASLIPSYPLPAGFEFESKKLGENSQQIGNGPASSFHSPANPHQGIAVANQKPRISGSVCVVKDLNSYKDFSRQQQAILAGNNGFLAYAPPPPPPPPPPSRSLVGMMQVPEEAAMLSSQKLPSSPPAGVAHNRCSNPGKLTDGGGNGVELGSGLDGGKQAVSHSVEDFAHLGGSLLAKKMMPLCVHPMMHKEVNNGDASLYASNYLDKRQNSMYFDEQEKGLSAGYFDGVSLARRFGIDYASNIGGLLDGNGNAGVGDRSSSIGKPANGLQSSFIGEQAIFPHTRPSYAYKNPTAAGLLHQTEYSIQEGSKSRIMRVSSNEEARFFKEEQNGKLLPSWPEVAWERELPQNDKLQEILTHHEANSAVKQSEYIHSSCDNPWMKRMQSRGSEVSSKYEKINQAAALRFRQETSKNGFSEADWLSCLQDADRSLLENQMPLLMLSDNLLIKSTENHISSDFTRKNPGNDGFLTFGDMGRVEASLNNRQQQDGGLKGYPGVSSFMEAEKKAHGLVGNEISGSSGEISRNLHQIPGSHLNFNALMESRRSPCNDDVTVAGFGKPDGSFSPSRCSASTDDSRLISSGGEPDDQFAIHLKPADLLNSNDKEFFRVFLESMDSKDSELIDLPHLIEKEQFYQRCPNNQPFDSLLDNILAIDSEKVGGQLLSGNQLICQRDGGVFAPQSDGMRSKHNPPTSNVRVAHHDPCGYPPPEDDVLSDCQTSGHSVNSPHNGTAFNPFTVMNDGLDAASCSCACSLYSQSACCDEVSHVYASPENKLFDALLTYLMKQPSQSPSELAHDASLSLEQQHKKKFDPQNPTRTLNKVGIEACQTQVDSNLLTMTGTQIDEIFEKSTYQECVAGMDGNMTFSLDENLQFAGDCGPTDCTSDLFQRSHATLLAEGGVPADKYTKRGGKGVDSVLKLCENGSLAARRPFTENMSMLSTVCVGVDEFIPALPRSDIGIIEHV